MLAEPVINRLFSLSLKLTACRSTTNDGPLAARLAEAIDETDGLICDVRAALFAQHVAGEEAAWQDLRTAINRIMQLADSSQDTLLWPELLVAAHSAHRALIVLDGDAS